MKNQLIVTVLILTAFAQNIFAQSDSTAFRSVITSYLYLKNALIRENGDSARAAAKILYNAINKVPMEKLSPEHHKVWMQYLEKLSYDAEHIKGTDDIEHQREHFGKLSVNMYKMLKALNLNTVDLYYQFCPMANDGKGEYWLSEEGKISNPYFGKRMPTCGSIKDTIRIVK